MAERILIVDDESEMLLVLRRLFTRKGYEVHCAECGEDAWKALDETIFDLVISDMAMEDLSGLDLLRRIRSADATIPFIIITGVGTIETAVKAIQLGAFHYITKPFKNSDIEILAQRALEYGKLHRKLDTLRLLDAHEGSFKTMVASSKPMQELMRRVEKIADSQATVLIQGETGTGKSLLAEKIHMNSSRREKPFLTIDCGALTETLLESELFGHVKGAFTGALRAKRGLMEEAQGGTVFLDEICEIRPSTQVKLLRAIQEGEIRPVGGNRTVKIDVRFVSATSRVLEEEVAKGRFREELYYRLAVVPLSLPPLRERREDIPLLIDHFLRKFCKLYRKEISQVKPDVIQMLLDSPWRGNIRELANILERGVLLSENGIITMDCIMRPDLRGRGGEKAPEERAVLPLKHVVEEAEKKAIVQALKTTQNNRTETARLLGISRRALYDKIAAYGLEA